MQPNMASVQARSRAYYDWVEDLFRVLDDLEETAAAATRVDAASLAGLTHALSAQAVRLRVVVNEGRLTGFADIGFGQEFAALSDSASALVEAMQHGAPVGVVRLPSSWTAIADDDARLIGLLRRLKGARRRLFTHQPESGLP